jgi:PhnB protein
MAANSVSEGSMLLTPYIIVKGADKAIAFYTKVLGAVEQYRLAGPDGRIGHAELRIGDSGLMLADESPSFGAFSPPSVGGTPVMLHLCVADVDATINKAEAEGATILRPAQDQFYGERSGMIVDPFGHQWHLGTPIEQVSPEEMQRRFDESFKEA